MNKTAKEVISYGLRILLLGTVAYGGCLFVAQAVVDTRNESLIREGDTYQTKEEAIKDLDTEKVHLGLEKVLIDIEFDDTCESAETITIDKSQYKIVFGRARNKYALKHEAYHIHEIVDGTITHWDTNPLLLSWNNIGIEWRATSYALEKDE